MRHKLPILTIAFVAILCTTATAQSDLGLKQAGLAVGVVDPEGIDTSFGLHFVRAEVEMVDPFTGGTLSVDDSSTKLGLDLGGGIVTPQSPRASLLVELWYGIVSDVNQLNLRLGFSHAL
jgi:hypothetical protein